jgi:hypothetical protein
VLFGCLETAAWVVSDPQGGELPACDADLDLILNDALGRVPLDSSVRVEVWRACVADGLPPPGRRTGRWLWTVASGCHGQPISSRT